MPIVIHIAARVRVSAATASQVMHDSADVRPQLREPVVKAVHGLAAIGRRVVESEAVRQPAENDRGAAAMGRAVKWDRRRIKRLEVIQWGQVLTAR